MLNLNLSSKILGMLLGLRVRRDRRTTAQQREFWKLGRVTKLQSTPQITNRTVGTGKFIYDLLHNRDRQAVLKTKDH